MNRRKFVVLIGSALVTPRLAFAQQGKLPRIGCLISETLAGQANRIEALRAGLQDLGYVEGKNILIEFRPADGNYDRLPELAAELVRLKVEVLVAFGAKAGFAAKNATATVPIVVSSITDPVALGIVGSLSRPGGNVTGISNFAELSGKQLELLKEAVPRAVRIGVLINSANRLRPSSSEALGAIAKSSKLQLQTFELKSPVEFAAVFVAMAKARIEAIWVSGDTLFQAHFREIAALAEKYRLPAVSRMEFAEVGGLIGYGVGDAGQFRRAAYFVDRILKGAKPDQLPVERGTRFELVINMKTAKAFGISIPQTLAVRADRVIE
jgi:putative ABC transport system substrate-binding protein